MAAEPRALLLSLARACRLHRMRPKQLDVPEETRRVPRDVFSALLLLHFIGALMAATLPFQATRHERTELLTALHLRLPA